MIQRKRVKRTTRKTRLETQTSVPGNGINRKRARVRRPQKQATGRALILHPVVKTKGNGKSASALSDLSPDAHLEEARG